MSALMRAKVVVFSVLKLNDCEVMNARPVCKKEPYGADGLDEDNTFSKFTPSGLIDLTVTNPALFGQIKEGDTLYVDFSKAD